MQNLTADYIENCKMLDEILRIDASFDLVGRTIVTGSRRAKLYYVDGLIKDDSMVKIVSDLLIVEPPQTMTATTARDFVDRFLPYTEVDVLSDIAVICKMLLSGAVVMLIEGYEQAAVIDARTYPARAVTEPESNRVLRGPHEGFVETLIFNTAMLRRRIRDVNLTVDVKQIGSRSKTDVAVCWLEKKVSRKMLDSLQKKLDSININALTMGQESLLECLLPKSRFNPFPKVRFTERPDAAAASLAEGSILIIVDCSPSAMILPTSFFAFMQDTNDYYFSPFTASFIRIVRLLIFSLTLFLIPTWFLLMQNPQWIPEWMSFIKTEETISVPVILQLLLVELAVDALKLASINTPSSLGNSLSVISALVLGDFAVQAGWLVAEVVLYMAFVAVATFTQPSFEMGWAFKISRLFVILMTQFFNVWGFAAGLLLVFIRMITTKTITGRDYLYPLITFNFKALVSLILRRPIDNSNS